MVFFKLWILFVNVCCIDLEQIFLFKLSLLCILYVRTCNRVVIHCIAFQPPCIAIILTITEENKVFLYIRRH